jgi:DNA helicase HerA-like ATPase
MGDMPKSAVSWRALLGRLSRLNRIKVFDPPSGTAPPLNYKKMLMPGVVSIVDLSDSGASELNNIVIAGLLRGLQDAQDDAYRTYEEAKRKVQEITPPTRVLLVIEEAHEFPSSERIEKMQNPFSKLHESQSAVANEECTRVCDPTAATPTQSRIRPRQLLRAPQDHRPSGCKHVEADG